MEEEYIYIPLEKVLEYLNASVRALIIKMAARV